MLILTNESHILHVAEGNNCTPFDACQRKDSEYIELYFTAFKEV